MKKIVNPFIKLDARTNYNCFGCSPNNKNGLQLEFWEDGQELVANWNPSKNLEGWMGVLHGGIQATLMDELGGWLVMTKLNTAGVTKELNVTYSKPVFISKGSISVRGKVIAHQQNLAKISCSLFDGNGQECATATIDYFCFPEKIAKAKYYYPGKEAFYQGNT